MVHPASFEPVAPAIVYRDGLERHVRLGQVVAEGLTIRPHDPLLWQRLEMLGEELRARYAGMDPATIETVRQVRALYHATGVDPTKRRPSSEALLRRVLRGQSLYRVNTLVDLINLASLRSLLPIGLYDLDRIEGPVEARLGRAGEPYAAIGRETFNVAGRLVLADARGPFGSPTSDSTRTMITPQTVRAMAVVFAPTRFSAARLERFLAELAEDIPRYCGGRTLHAVVVPAQSDSAPERAAERGFWRP